MKKNRFCDDPRDPYKGKYYNEGEFVGYRFMFVYKIICKPTNEVYYGQHVCLEDCKDPLTSDHYRGSGKQLLQRIKEYDWTNDFEFHIVEFCNDSRELNAKEHALIEDAQNDPNIKCLNNKNSPFIRLHKKKIYVTRRPITNVFDFVSPLNGKFFAKNTVWSSLKQASLDLGFKNHQQVSSIIFDCKKEIPGEWSTCLYKRDSVLITRFVHCDELEKQKEEIENYVEKNRQNLIDNKKICEEYYQNISLFGSTRALININEFDSPINNRHFDAGIVWKSSGEFCKAVGFELISTCNLALYNKSHFLEWWTQEKTKPKFVVKLIEPKDLNPLTNDSNEIRKQCAELWNSVKNSIYEKQASFKRSGKNHPIIVLETVSINGNTFEEGIVFKSIRECSIVMGFKTHSTIRYRLEVKDGYVGGGRIGYYEGE